MQAQKHPNPCFMRTMEPMADLVLVYGMRLLPADEIEAQLRLSIEAFFDFYPEI